MVLTRATLEKLGKEELISMFLENYEKLNNNVTQLTNQLAETDKKFKRVESQLALRKFVNVAGLPKPNYQFGKQCWKNKHYSQRECIEMAGIN